MKLSERAYLKISGAMPEAFAARLDLARAARLAGAPLNGQVVRQQIVRDLVDAVDFDEVVETGTFRGATTQFFSHLTGRPVHSVELMPRFHRFAEVRCAGDPGVHLRLGDSRSFLVELARTLGHHTTLFYLDAHWQPDVPRFEEITIIASRWSRAVVMIDDFAVPGDPGYGFTHYDGVPLTIDYLPALPGWHRFRPSAPSTEETGARRGCIVLVSPQLTDLVRGVPSLRSLDERSDLIRADAD